MSSVENIDIEVRSLETCAFTNQMFRDVLAKVQKAVDELNLHSYSNLSAWVSTLDEQASSKYWCHIQCEVELLNLIYSGLNVIS